MKFSLYVMFFVIFKAILTSKPNNELDMVVDVINSYHKPTSPTLCICWKQSITRDFISKFNEAPKFVHIVDNIEDIKDNLLLKDLLIVIDISCNKCKIFLEKGNKLKKFTAPYRWLLIAKDINGINNITSELQKLDILIDSNVVLSEKNSNGYILHMPYKIQVNKSEIIWEYFGTWTPINGLTKANRMNVAIAMRRKDLGGMPVATSLVITNRSSKRELNSLNNIHIDTLSKTGYRQIGPLYSFMNATKVIVFSDTWGYLINGTWTGMIGNIVRLEAELIGTVMFITIERLQVIDYLSYPSPLTARFVFREPALSYQNNLFLLPFKPTVWFCIIALIAVLGLILFVNATWERQKMLNIETPDETTLRPNVSDIAIMIIGAISQQGSSTELKGTLGRVVMFLLFIAFVFLYMSYSANIIVLLQSTSNQIRTLTDLYNSKLELGSEDTPYNRYHFSTATEPIRKAIYENKIAPRGSKPNFMALEEGVKKLQTQPFAFNMNLGTGYKAIENTFYEHEKCGLQEIEYIEMNKPWQGCRKHSPYKEIYKIGLVRIQEHGLNYRENRIVYAKKPICSVHGGGFASVSMIDFYPALLMLLYGILLSCILLLVEILHHRRAQFYAPRNV